MSDESRYRAGAGGGARKQGWTAAQPARVPQRPGDDRSVEPYDKAQAFVMGANGTTLAAVNALRPAEDAGIAARLVSLAWTPLGIVIGDNHQDVTIPLSGIFDWIDRAFPADDEDTFVASMRDLELLARIGWEARLPEPLDDQSVLNIEDLPEDLAAALGRPPVALVACAACRRLCVRDDFIWKEEQLCAWDYHSQVFGKRGPWREGPYEARHFETLPSCAYVAPELLTELSVEVLLSLGELPDAAIATIVNALLACVPAHSQMAVKTAAGLVVLRET